MARRFRLEVSIAARQIRLQDVAQQIPTRAGERTTCRKAFSGTVAFITLLKVAVVLGVLIILALLVFRAVRPYLKLIRQFIQAIRYFQQPNSPSPSSRREGEKLVKCAACDTWIPESRVLHANIHEFCSRECLERAGTRARKAG